MGKKILKMDKVFILRLLSGEDDDFVRDFEIKADQPLLELHYAIQKNLHFDPGLMSSFFTTDASWNKGEEIPLMNMTGAPDARTMENTQVGDLVSGKSDRLLYLYDYLSNRGFFMEVVNISDADKDKTYPFCSYEKGNPPQQLVFEDLTGMPEEDLFPDDEDDDLLSDGFEDIDDLPEI